MSSNCKFKNVKSVKMKNLPNIYCTIIKVHMVIISANDRQRFAMFESLTPLLSSLSRDGSD